PYSPTQVSLGRSCTTTFRADTSCFRLCGTTLYSWNASGGNFLPRFSVLRNHRRSSAFLGRVPSRTRGCRAGSLLRLRRPHSSSGSRPRGAGCTDRTRRHRPSPTLHAEPPVMTHSDKGGPETPLHRPTEHSPGRHASAASATIRDPTTNGVEGP